MTLLTLGVALGVLGYVGWQMVGWWWEPRISRHWRRDQDRAEMRNTFTGINWNWDAMKRRHQ